MSSPVKAGATAQTVLRFSVAATEAWRLRPSANAVTNMSLLLLMVLSIEIVAFLAYQNQHIY